MQFDLSHDLPWPAELVFRTHRDRPMRLAAYLPRVDRIERLWEGGTPDRVEHRNRWVVPVSGMPGLVQAVWPHEAFSWTEHALWVPRELELHWRQVPDLHPEAVTAQGVIRYEDEDDETVVWVDGTFELHLDRLDRVPPALAAHGADLERVLFELLRPNFRMLMDGLDRLLGDEI